jgi:hypothetical protein
VPWVRELLLAAWVRELLLDGGGVDECAEELHRRARTTAVIGFVRVGSCFMWGSRKKRKWFMVAGIVILCGRASFFCPPSFACNVGFGGFFGLSSRRKLPVCLWGFQPSRSRTREVAQINSPENVPLAHCSSIN